MNNIPLIILVLVSFLTFGCRGQGGNANLKTGSINKVEFNSIQTKRASMIAALFEIEKFIYNDYELLLQNHRVLNATSREIDIADPTNPIVVNGTIRDEGHAIRLIDCETGTITVGPTVRIDERGSGIYSGIADFIDFYGVSTKHEYGAISDCPVSSIPIKGGKYYHGKISYESNKNGDVKGVLGIYPNGRKPQPFYFEVSFGRIKARQRISI